MSWTTRAEKTGKLEIIPRYQFVPKGQDLDPRHRGFLWKRGRSLRLSHNMCDCILRAMRRNPGYIRREKPAVTPYDVCDGRRENGRTIALHQFSALVPAGASRTVELVYSMKREVPGTEQSDARTAKGSRSRTFPPAGLTGFGICCAGPSGGCWRETARFSDPTARMLAKSAGQFISSRESTGADTILAGFPFF